MKHWLSGLLAALMLFSLTGCGGMADLTDVSDDSQGPHMAEEWADPEGPESPESPPEEAEEEEAPEYSIDPDSDILNGLISPGCCSDLEECWVFEDGTYTSKEDVACYIHFYGRLPDNFITKKQAQDLGWSGGSLEPYAPGQNLCIGGSYFGNYEGLLPEAEGRTYTECDIDTLGAGSRGAKRLVFSNDGLIYYTEDHYKTFELLYGDESND